MDSILTFLHNQQFAIILGMIVAFVYKYVPAFKSFSNGLCAFLVALTAWATNVLAPDQAHAATVALSLGFLGPVASPLLGIIDALIAKLIHDNVMNPAYKAFGMKSPGA